MECGVPQISILGPLLFLIYDLEIKDFLTDCIVITYANDTVMLFKSYMVDRLFAIMDTAFAQLFLRMHRLSLNILETKYMISSNIQHFETNKILSFGNFVAERVTNFMYLGMIIDEMVIWKDHQSINQFINTKENYYKSKSINRPKKLCL